MPASASEISLRLAKDGDAAEIASVHLNSWRESYSGLLPDEFISELPSTFRRRMEHWARTIRNKPSGTEIWVAESKSAGIVGFASVVEARDEKFRDHGELAAIYLLKQFQHQGIGFALLSAAFEFLRSRGLKKAYCWVLKGNPTIKFYEKSGGRIGSETKTGKRPKLELHEVMCIWDGLASGE